MLEHSQRDEVGCVGAKLYYPNDTIQHAGVIIGIGGIAGHSHKYFERRMAGYFSRLELIQNLSAVTAACLMVKTKIFKELNGLNEENLKIAFNDVDFCLRVQEKGYKNIFTPYCEAYHHESISRGGEDNPEKIARFGREIDYMKKRHIDILLCGDPYYNPKLTLDREDFSLR
jgi:GT2 family glycosyltransferase